MEKETTSKIESVLRFVESHITEAHGALSSYGLGIDRAREELTDAHKLIVRAMRELEGSEA